MVTDTRTRIKFKVTFLSGETLTVDVEPMGYLKARRVAIEEAARKLGLLKVYSPSVLFEPGVVQTEILNKRKPGRRSMFG